MKALKAIGIGKAFRFVWGQCLLGGLRLAVLPQVRVLLLRMYGARIGSGTIIHHVRFINYYRSSFRNLKIGSDCFVGHEALFDLTGGVEFGDQVTFAQRSCILTHLNVGYADHPLQARFPHSVAGVRIGSGSYVGVSVTILPGVEIGEQTCVAAGALVSRSIPPRSIARGVPARVFPLDPEPAPGAEIDQGGAA